MRNCKFLIVLLTGLLLTFTVSSTYAFSFFDIFKSHPEPKPKPRTMAHTIKQVQPTQVKIGIYVLHVGKYDFQGANYRMDFYLFFKCSPVCKDINYEIMNANNMTSKLITKQNDLLIYRIEADLNKSNNLRNYPFDNHTLDILIEDRQLTQDKIIFAADPKTTALDADLSVVGFHLLQRWSATVSKHYYQVFERTFSSYKFSIFIQRPILAGIIKGILPALIIICCNFLALFMRIENISQRLSIATSTLIASVVFHLNLTSAIPPLGYLTFADMFMFINYVFLLLVLMDVVGTMFFVETKHKDMARKINRIAAFSIPAAWLMVQAINWIWFNPTGTTYT